jgi:hypothetical protein
MPRKRIAVLGVTAAIGALAIVLSLLARQTGERRAQIDRSPDALAETERDAGIELDAPTIALARPRSERYECALPAIDVARDPRCASGEPYPRCRWQLPDDTAASGLYVVWRNTTPEHRWARPGLVTLVLAAAREYQARWPGEHLTVGDLDAAGPRHQTHDRGVDVDLYLEHAMLDVNAGGRDYVDNYASRSADEVEGLRDRVMDLARILATCSRGRLRIYYNDPEIVTPFVAWFAESGFVSDVGPAMMMHNRLHRFHFHMTVPEDLPPLGEPSSPPGETTPGGTE